MFASIETFTENLQRLIAKFESDKAHYFSRDYSEAQTRIDFVTSFFKALGWGGENEAGLAPPELNRLERESAATDAEIDNLVYELCEIAEEESNIIEGS